jgi:hypothetical protein
MNEIEFLNNISGLADWDNQKAIKVNGQTWDAFVHPSTGRLIVVATTGNEYPKLHAAYVLKCRTCHKPVFSQKLYTRKEFEGYRRSKQNYSGHMHIGRVKHRKLRKLLKGLGE